MFGPTLLQSSSSQWSYQLGHSRALAEVGCQLQHCRGHAKNDMAAACGSAGFIRSRRRCSNPAWGGLPLSSLHFQMHVRQQCKVSCVHILTLITFLFSQRFLRFRPWLASTMEPNSHLGGVPAPQAAVDTQAVLRHMDRLPPLRDIMVPESALVAQHVLVARQIPFAVAHAYLPTPPIHSSSHRVVAQAWINGSSMPIPRAANRMQAVFHHVDRCLIPSWWSSGRKSWRRSRCHWPSRTHTFP